MQHDDLPRDIAEILFWVRKEARLADSCAFYREAAKRAGPMRVVRVYRKGV